MVFGIKHIYYLFFLENIDFVNKIFENHSRKQFSYKSGAQAKKTGAMISPGLFESVQIPVFYFTEPVLKMKRTLLS